MYNDRGLEFCEEGHDKDKSGKESTRAAEEPGTRNEEEEGREDGEEDIEELYDMEHYDSESDGEGM